MTETRKHIHISIGEQSLALHQDDSVIMQCPVSTAGNGPGELMDSECTPRGEHRIAEKIGDGSPVNMVFVGRLPTGEIFEPALRELHPERDWILTRILWLEGLEEGKNKGGNVDTYRRYIYIHGSPDDVDIGCPGSHGCIRMRNDDMIALFDQVSVGDTVTIHE